jgi:cholesterol transport system auxiliary component
MRNRQVVVVGVVLIVSACSIGRPIPTATTYSIEPAPSAPYHSTPSHPERLRVERVRVAAPYDRAALVYRVSAVRYMPDPYHTFLADPGSMLSNRIAEWLATTQVFKAVEGPGGAAPAPWVLEATVTELYGDFQAGGNGPSAVMSIRFTIIDEGNARPRVAYERLLSQRVSVSSASPEALVLGYQTALGDILTQLATDLSKSTLQ